MNMYETTFKQTLSPILAWSFTENIWLRRLLGLTFVPTFSLLLITLTIVLLPFYVWDNTLKDLVWDMKTLIIMIGAWF